MGHGNFFETTRYNRRNMKEKIDWKKLSVMDHADNIEKKKKVKRVVLAQYKTVSSRGGTHALE